MTLSMGRSWVGSSAYRAAIDAVIKARTFSGVSQRELARRLGKHPSFVNKIELMERRLDIVEFVAIARALKIEPAVLFSQMEAVLPLELSV